MFRRDKISVDQINKVLSTYSSETPELIYYNIREIVSTNSIHLDILFLFEKTKIKDNYRMLPDMYIDEGILDRLYKIGGNVLKGRDYNFGTISHLYINTKFINKK